MSANGAAPNVEKPEVKKEEKREEGKIERKPGPVKVDGRQQQQQRMSPYAQMLNDAIKESKNPEVAKTKEAIDAVRKERADVIGKVKEARRRLTYKEAEDAALKRLLDIERAKPEAAEKRRKIGYLKRLKNKLEFRISTEASSLADEKGLVRQIEDVNKQLSEAYKIIRLERKAELVKKDMEEFKKTLADGELKIAEHDKKLDELYDTLRKLLGIEKGRGPNQQQHPQHQQEHKRRPQSQPQLQEINLEDIVVIKKKEKKPVDVEESA